MLAGVFVILNRTNLTNESVGIVPQGELPDVIA
jgi:hypothetical protein